MVPDNSYSRIRSDKAFFYLLWRFGCAFLIVISRSDSLRACMVCPHDSAGNVRITDGMWMNLVQISPFSHGLLTQQLFKVTHADFGS